MGPIAGADIAANLDPSSALPSPGYQGAPLTGIIIGELLRLGHSVTAITTDSTLNLNGKPQIAVGQNFRYIACPARKHAWRNNGIRLGRVVDLFGFERHALQRVLSEVSADVIHAHWTYEFALAAITQKTPHLITCHDSPSAVLQFTKSPYRALRHIMATSVFKRGKNFSVVSDYLAHELRKYLPTGPAIIPNPIAPYIEQLARVRTKPKSRQIAMISNGWDRRKNAEAALLAFNAYKKFEPTAELYLYGSGYGSAEIASAWARERGIEAGMHFCGRLPHRDLTLELASKDCLLHPSLEESFGVVLAEAMALGLPVVGGSTSGAVPWVVGEPDSSGISAGVLTNVEDPNEIALALQEVFDESYEHRSARAVSRSIGSFSVAAVTRAYESEYARIISMSSTPTQAAFQDHQ